ncbi:hypothetical protein F4Z98_03310 [Candidatus Poribacteria bacterium]|nr:hypothetical protein [Candidatus Poribacteria bacterium]MYA99391.1 hypothetical protein [Candidatus Poribacteria bacterium]MYI35256.1 hypothetical protein [Acidimicrobiaceae bacterium]
MKEGRGKRLNVTKLSAAAFLFTQGINTAKGLAEKVEIAEGTIYKWVKLPEWQKALDDLKFTGDRTLHREWRDIDRESGDEVDLARQLYIKHRRQGMRKGQADKAVAKVLNCSDKRIFNWRKRNGWDDEVKQ